MTKIPLFCVLALLLAMIWSSLGGGENSGLIARDIELGLVTLHEAIWVEVPVVSGSSEPIRLLGVTSSCNPAGCVLESELPNTIEPFGTAVMRVQFRPEQSGRFERRVEFYAEGTPHYRNAFTIRGTGQASDEDQTAGE